MQRWKIEQFLTNHFVLRLPCSDTMPNTYSISDNEGENAEVHIRDVGRDDADGDHVDDYSADAGTAVEMEVNDADDVVDDGKATSAPASSVSADTSSDCESVDTDDYDVKQTDVPAAGMHRLPDDTWLSTETVYRLLRSSSSDSIHKKTVPRGHSFATVSLTIRVM